VARWTDSFRILSFNEVVEIEWGIGDCTNDIDSIDGVGGVDGGKRRGNMTMEIYISIFKCMKARRLDEALTVSAVNLLQWHFLLRLRNAQLVLFTRFGPDDRSHVTVFRRSHSIGRNASCTKLDEGLQAERLIMEIKLGRAMS
jgi:hypothetical protein